MRDLYQKLENSGVVAVMRGDFTADNTPAVTTTLLEEGITIFEMTMNSTDPIGAMQAVKQAHGDAAFVGMGTVLTLEETERVLAAGADFVVSPAYTPAIVQAVQDAGKPMIPGVITPSEAVSAWAMGVRVLKLFPIGPLGVAYFKTMFGPLKHMNFMCNGAINQENARAFIAAGAVACGVGGWLTGDGHTPTETIRARARTLDASIRAAKSNENTTLV